MCASPPPNWSDTFPAGLARALPQGYTMKTILTKLNRFFQGQWRLAVLHPEKGLWPVAPLLDSMAYLKAQNANGCHILMQPVEPSRYLLADDLSWDTIRRHHRSPDGAWKPGRMVVETSPANFQVWIHSLRSLTLPEKSFWLKKLRSDPAAHPHNRWGRCPGFRNRKGKYRTPQGEYPLARLIWVDWIRRANIPALPQTIPPPQKPLPLPSPRGPVCHHKTIARRDYLRPNESQTDFAYTLALLRRGYSDLQIRERLLNERTSWENHHGERKRNLYLERTIRRAKEIVEKSPNTRWVTPNTAPSDSSCSTSSTETPLECQKKLPPTPFSPD